MNIDTYMREIGQKARVASRQLAAAESGQKNAALLAIAAELKNRQQDILVANALDMNAGRENGLDDALLDR